MFGVIAGGLAQWLWWAGIQADIRSAAVGASGGASALLATAGWAIGGRANFCSIFFKTDQAAAKQQRLSLPRLKLPPQPERASAAT